MQLPDPPIPRPLFKFMETAYAADLVTKGSTRLGTLYDFRRAEKHEYKVLDIDEGKFRYSERVTHATTMDQLGPTARKQFYFAPGSTFQMNGVDTWEDVSAPNCYVYCFSLSDSWSADIDPNYSTCVQVVNPDEFALGLAECISALHGSGRVVRWRGDFVVYADRVSHTDNTDGVLSARRIGEFLIPFIKPKEFASQQEYRLIFGVEGIAGTLEPRVIQNSRLAASTRKHSDRP